MDVKTEALLRWREGRFLETGRAIPDISHLQAQWVPYEGYMRAMLVRSIPGEPGKLIVDFPPEASEDNRLHIHPISDRLITVIRGHGEFIAVRHRRVARFAIEPGCRVWMPRGVLHTFLASAEGLTVESLHNPFVTFDNPLCLVYPRKETYHVRL